MRPLIAAAALLAASALVAPISARAQSLGQVAAESKEKKKTGKPAKTYTEEDLGKAKAPSNVMEGATGATEAKPPADAAAGQDKPAEKGSADLEKAWRDKMKKATDDVARLQQQVDALQSDANNNQVDPYAPGRLQLLQKLEDSQKQLAVAQQKVTDIEDEGRRSGWR